MPRVRHAAPARANEPSKGRRTAWTTGARLSRRGLLPRSRIMSAPPASPDMPVLTNFLQAGGKALASLLETPITFAEVEAIAMRVAKQSLNAPKKMARKKSLTLARSFCHPPECGARGSRSAGTVDPAMADAGRAVLDSRGRAQGAHPADLEERGELQRSGRRRGPPEAWQHSSGLPADGERSAGRG